MTAIRFYGPDEPWGEFSNFYPSPVTVDGLIWPTSEHYFQAAKFPGLPQAGRIRREPTPAAAKSLGGDRTVALRADWLTVRDEVMRTGLLAKFTQHRDLRALLVGTGDTPLVEHTEHDAYWGDGGDGSGVNRLGQLLMQIRAELA
ncbi:NADAR family protein [Nakamurella sp.]|uniref:NADAR family protein n=1 Tax=Nakamurella sp. TaxID=1869182 RepID=UPI003B3AB35B